MDGFKRRLNESVQLKLSATLSLAILLVAGVAGVFSFLSALDEAHELQDDLLRQVAQLVGRHHLPPATPADRARPWEGNEESRVTVQRLGDPTGDDDDGGPLPLPATLADGLQTVVAGGETFRVLVRTMAGGDRIAVSQEAGFRNQIARAGALRAVTPLLVLVPILLLIVAKLVRQMFRPIAALSSDIDLRAEQALHPVEDGHLPVEVRPFAVAINRLLARVGLAMDAQHRFVADAAHELRSPLTVLSLQAERLAQADMSGPARERLVDLRRGIERSRSLLDQLLALARAQSAAEPPQVPVSVQGVYRRVLEDLVPLAHARRIDIGLEDDGAQDAWVWASEPDLTAVVRNLVDNAILYTPEGGRVDLSVRAEPGRAVLRIQDNGPGIPPAERERVFDPFYRLLGSGQIGSGLGLSIVRTTAQRIGADIRLDYADAAAQTGLSVEVSLRAAGAADSAGLRPA